jgi:hypothetical protein
MAVALIAGLCAIYALLVLVGIGLAKAAGAGDRHFRRTRLDEAPVVAKERRRASVQPWTGAERRGPGRAVLS